MTLSALILFAVAVSQPVLTATPQGGLNPPAKEQIEASTRKIKMLQSERIAILEEAVDVLNRLFASSRGEYRDVQEARHLLLQAQLDSAEKTADRIALYKSEIDSMKKLEEIAGSHVKRGTGTVATVLQAKARRLAVEIQLEREMIKQAKEGK